MPTPSVVIPGKIPWIESEESARGYSASSPYPNDISNRSLKWLLLSSGYDPDASVFPGLYGPIANVKNCGAKGDGIANDTAAILLALASTHNIYIPEGIYNISSSIFFGLTLGKSIKGAGKGRTILRCIGSPFHAITSFGDGSNGNFNVEISDLTLDGNNIGQTGIFFDYTYHSVIRNVEVKNCTGDGIKIQRGFYNTVYDCRSHLNTGNGLLLGQTANANTVIGGHFDRNTQTGILIYSENALDRAHGNTILGATSESNDAYNMQVYDSDENRFIGCYTESALPATTIALVSVNAGPGQMSNYNVFSACNFQGAILSATIDRGTDTLFQGNSINYGVTISINAVRTKFITNPRIQGTITDNSTTTVFFDPSKLVANADTSGATLGQLEIEVNEIKAALRAQGLIST